MSKIKKQTFEEGLDWNKGYFITEGDLPSENLLYIWGLKDLKVLNLFTGKPHFSFMGIGRKENVICCFLLLPSYRYFVIGYQNGQLKIWKLFDGKKIIHTYDGHTRAVDSLMLHREQRCFWSTSSDQTIRLWNLDSFSLIYTFQLPGLYVEITMLSYDRFMAEHENMICLGTTNNYKKLITTHGAKVLNGAIQYENGFSENARSLILTLDNNSGICIWTKSFQDENTDYSKSPIGVFYPPPKSKGILEIHPSPYDYDEYVMLLENGDICVSKMDRGTGVMTQIQNCEKIVDFEGHQIRQTASLIRFINIDTPLYDIDFGRQNDGTQKFQTSQADSISLLTGHDIDSSKAKLFLVGLSKGSIIFVSLKKLHIIYSKISYHREKIIAVEGVCQNKSDQKCTILASLCEEGFIRFVRFVDERAECIRSFNSNGNICNMKAFSNRILFVSKKGQFSIFKYINSQLRCFTNDEGNEHDLPIISVNICAPRKLIITSSYDEKIKLWSYRKILLIQLNVNDSLHGAWFINNEVDIVIAHDGKLSILQQKSIRLLKINIKQTNQNFKPTRLNGLSFEDYYSFLRTQFKNQSKYPERTDKKVHFQEQMDQQKISDIDIMERSLIVQKKSQKKQKQPNAINYIGGKIILPSLDKGGKSTILIRGSDEELEQIEDLNNNGQKLRSFSQTQPPSNIDKKIQQERKQHFSNYKKSQVNNDWDALEKYEKNRKNGHTIISALPRVDNNQMNESFDLSASIEKSLQRKIMTRRDITLNRIFLQSFLKTSEVKENPNTSQVYK